MGVVLSSPAVRYTFERLRYAALRVAVGRVCFRTGSGKGAADLASDSDVRQTPDPAALPSHGSTDVFQIRRTRRELESSYNLSPRRPVNAARSANFPAFHPGLGWR